MDGTREFGEAGRRDWAVQPKVNVRRRVPKVEGA
jgi:hypothetical protein